ncbi:Aurora kinase, putative [Eimeria acervulina]|uniref:Aurora kinase, putative n=1 Tax=Eimeria acervulina TaxID=5801 RepID=U6GG52_EIMAC|nr:Aurora kinase, putative [Eimeria acervulina]CDI79155.1 Aurora kinase, putative [Eimeria acervulina]
MWKELQLHLLQRHPTVDLEKLVSGASVTASEVAAELSPCLATPRSSALVCPQQAKEFGSSPKQSTVSKGSAVAAKSSVSRFATRLSAVPSRQYLSAERAANIPVLSNRKCSGKLDLDAVSNEGCRERLNSSSLTETPAKKGPSIIRNASTSTCSQPRRRTLPKATQTPGHTRTVRCTNRVAGTERTLATECSESSDICAAHSASKRNASKGRPTSVGQRNRNRKAPLVDQSFDLPSATWVMEKLEASPCLQEDSPTTNAMGGVPANDQQQHGIGASTAGSTSKYYADPSQHIPFSCLAGCSSREKQDRAAGEIQSPMSRRRQGVAFCVDEQSTDDLANCSTVVSEDADFYTSNDATSLRSLKKLRSVSANPNGLGRAGATLRLRSTPSKHHVEQDPTKVLDFPHCRLRIGSEVHHGLHSPSQQPVASSPSAYDATNAPAVGNKQRTLSKSTKSHVCTKLGPTGLDKEQSFKDSSTECLSQGPLSPEVSNGQGVPPDCRQSYSQQVAPPDSNLEHCQGYTGNGYTRVQWCTKISECQMPVNEGTTPGEAGRLRPYLTFQAVPKRRLANCVAAIPAVQHLYFPRPETTASDGTAALSHSTVFPNGQGLMGQVHPKDTMGTIPKRMPYERGVMDGTQARRLPVVISMPQPSSTKFVSSPSSLFSSS